MGDGQKSGAVLSGAFKGGAKPRGRIQKGKKLELEEREAEETGVGSKGGPAVRPRGLII